MSIHWLSY